MMLWSLVCLCGCTRTVYVPMESERVEKESELGVLRVADTVILAERCTVRITPDGVNSVVQRELHHLKTVHDTLRTVRVDTVRVVKQVPMNGACSVGRRGWWMIAGVLAGVVVSGALYRIFRRFV